MKLAFLAPGNLLDIGTWSGIPFHMFRAAQVEFPNSIPIYSPPPTIYQALRWRLAVWTDYSVELDWLKIVAAVKARSVLFLLKKLRPDLVISIANTPVGAYVSRHYPLVHISDTTFGLMENYYADFSKFRPWVKRSANELERLIITRSQACLYPSQWAAESAIRDYGADPERIHFFPWGNNFEFKGEPEDFSDRIGLSAPCPIVFIGVDWERKGGDIALETVLRLRRAGIRAHLHVIGVKPEGAENTEAVTWHGFISKATPEGAVYLDSVLKVAAFLLLPTRQECLGMVFGEANSRGIPAITTLTGGVGSVVKQGINGYALALSDGPQAYADLIAEIWSNPQRYLALRDSARKYSETTLDWRRWATHLREIIETLDL